MSYMIKLGLIGYGYWGPNLFRNFQKLENCEIDYVIDSDLSKLNELKKIYPKLHVSHLLDELLDDTDIDAVIISTPVSTHYSIAHKSLEKGKHVLIEKPMTDSVESSQKLIELSKKNSLTLMVDHTYLYTGTIQKIKKIITDKEIGSINYIDSVRTNLGLFQSDINVLWDLAPHDISICNYLMNELPISVQAIGKSHTKNYGDDIVYLILHYASNKIAHFNCSWISPIKIRQLIIGGTEKMIVFDDTKENEKISLCDKNFKEIFLDSENKSIIEYNLGTDSKVSYDDKEALESLANDFINSILNNSKPISDYDLGLNVVRILEASQESMNNENKIIPINYSC
jgi:predicted dehydrogenase